MLSVLALGAAVLLVVRRVTGPLRVLSDVAARIAEGDLTGRVEHRSRDEIGALAETLEAMRQIASRAWPRRPPRRARPAGRGL